MGRYLCVLFGGGIGSLTRYIVGRAIVQRFPHVQFALGTFLINVTGSFLIGLLVTLIVERFRLSHNWYLLIVVGFLGGYTTFSSYEYDGYLAVRSGNPLGALLYLVSSVVFGYAAVWLGVLFAGRR
ncbi:MAG: fluoride efflux transporter CrcB [Acidobacteriaceae bacterium]|nr:fluoride efflux transporter CrcB [Acidobacteriaceae bacterium]